MEKKKLSLFLRFLIIVLAITIIAGVVARDHLIFGTILIIGRWIFIVFALFCLYRFSRRATPRSIKLLLTFSVTLIFVEHLWNKFSEASLTESEETVEVSLMTYNLFFGNQNMDRTLQLIEDQNPDILALQEYTPRWDEKISRSLDSGYPYKKTLTSMGAYGIGIYSKFPILSEDYLRNSDDLPFAQIVELEIGSKTIQLINTHLASPAIALENPDRFFNLLGDNYLFRESQLREISEFATRKSADYSLQILIGDLNITHYEPLYRNLRNTWVDLYSKVGEGWGQNFPNSHSFDPFITLDYILAKGAVRPLSMNVIYEGTSDHFPIFGRVEL